MLRFLFIPHITISFVGVRTTSNYPLCTTSTLSSPVNYSIFHVAQEGGRMGEREGGRRANWEASPMHSQSRGYKPDVLNQMFYRTPLSSFSNELLSLPYSSFNAPKMITKPKMCSHYCLYFSVALHYFSIMWKICKVSQVKFRFLVGTKTLKYNTHNY